MGGFNGAGTYVRYYNWTNDANSNVDITASRFDIEDNGYATGLSNCICRDGQTTITQNIPFNNKKITGLGAGTNAADASQLGQVAKGGANYAVATGTANAIVLSMSPVNAALTDGQEVKFQAIANNTGATTLAVDGLGTAPALITPALIALVGGEILINGEYTARWSTANSKWVLLNSSANVAANITGNAATATKLVTARTIAMTGDVAYTSADFDGSGNVTGAGTLATVNSNIGTFNSLTVNGKGQVTAASNVTIVTLGTPAATTSGTAVTISGIPSTAKIVTISLVGVALSGSQLLAQIGPAGGISATGYVSGSTNTGTSGGSVGNTSTTGLILSAGGSSGTYTGTFTLTLENSSNNTWCIHGGLVATGTNQNTHIGFGSVSLSGPLSQIKLTTASGSATFSAGEINISYV